MIRSCVCVLVGVVLAVAVGANTPSRGTQNEEVKSAAQDPALVPSPHATRSRTREESKNTSEPGRRNEEVKSHAQPGAPIFSPHGMPARTRMEGDKTPFQPGRIEYSYPLYGDPERHKSVAGLRQLTVDLLALHSMYKEAHWDLTGPLFLPLHEYYQRQADFYLQQADLFAGRVLQLGASVEGRFSTIARTTKLAEMPEGYLTDDHSLKLLLDRVTVLQKEIYELIGATERSDPPTSNKLQDLAHAVDKDLWQTRAHLQKPSARRGDLPWVRQQAPDHSGR